MDVGMAGWRAFWQLLRDSDCRAEYRIDEASVALPYEVESIFGVRTSASPLLTVYLDGIELNCHFFTDQDIELDLDPREISSQGHLDLLLGFMRRLGAATAKSVVITPENKPELPIIRYEPEVDSFFRAPAAPGTR